MSIIQSTAKSGGTAAAGFYDYPIENSLRFDGSSYLSRTFGNANQKTFTYSTWAKLGISPYEQDLFAGGPADDQLHISVISNRFGIRIYRSNASLVETYTINLLRDYSSWYHFVVSVDTTQSNDIDKVKIYINGVNSSLVDSSGGTVDWPSTDELFYIDESMYIGRRAHSNDNLLYGYLANIQFIDGQALTASSFGETKSGVWIPKAYTGSYGTNGFRLTFSNASDLGEDSSGNNNDWTVN